MLQKMIEVIEEKAKIIPFLKWAGGKRQLLPEIRKYVPTYYKCYFEPFLGAGAVFFDIQPKKAVINDSNKELINCYKVIKDNLEELILDLSKHHLSENYYYEVREIDRNSSFKELSDVKRASRFIYLNHTCFNGLYRVNSKGYFNVPFGKYKNPNFQNCELLKNISYKDVLDYIISVNCEYYFDYIPLQNLGLPLPEDAIIEN